MRTCDARTSGLPPAPGCLEDERRDALAVWNIHYNYHRPPLNRSLQNAMLTHLAYATGGAEVISLEDGS
ncbi:hypothetical protein [Streptomyces sp. NPDC058629]|uniref:hypothetical protein n=1 Tax=Streptomyces sp. NPDC058629 TaxID=3346565 RepID=UPI00364EE0A6